MRLAIALAMTLLVQSAQASTKRYAVVIGNDHGDADELSLRYAVSDAQKVFSTLVGVGDVAIQSAIIAANQEAQEVRRALIDTNQRIRKEIQTSGRDTVLIVYYSGHGDEESLHMGGSRFDLEELRSLVLSSPATVRILVLDSCRSGPLPRTKGGSPAPSFSIDVDDRLQSSGAVLITASAANEDAQESDELKSSFFTHHLVSGLLGAADISNDGLVSLEEAYNYAYAGTVRSSSQSAGNPQHPSFHYDVKGMGDIALAKIDAKKGRGKLRLSEAGHYFVFADNENGELLAEVHTGSGRKELTLPAGQYFIRRRANDHLRQGSVPLVAGKVVQVSMRKFPRIAYARVVRKGGTSKRTAHSLRLDFRQRGPVLTGMGAMPLVGLRYNLALSALTISPEVAFGQQDSANVSLTARTRELQMGLRVTRGFDIRTLTLSAGVVAGLSRFSQQFQTQGVAPSKNAIAGYTGLTFELQHAIAGPVYASLNADLLTYILNQQGSMESSRVTPLTYLFSAGIGTYF